MTIRGGYAHDVRSLLRSGRAPGGPVQTIYLFGYRHHDHNGRRAERSGG